MHSSSREHSCTVHPAQVIVGHAMVGCASNGAGSGSTWFTGPIHTRESCLWLGSTPSLIVMIDWRAAMVNATKVIAATNELTKCSRNCSQGGAVQRVQAGLANRTNTTTEKAPRILVDMVLCFIKTVNSSSMQVPCSRHSHASRAMDLIQSDRQASSATDCTDHMVRQSTYQAPPTSLR
jgi:hypothetical protein